MKTFIYSLLLVFALFACDDKEKEIEYPLDGPGIPINPERNEVTVGAEGDTISIKTETIFWLHHIVEYKDGVETQYIFNELEDVEDRPQFLKVMTGDWYQVEEREREVYFVIAPNDTGKERAIEVSISSGNTGDDITVTQSAD